MQHDSCPVSVSQWYVLLRIISWWRPPCASAKAAFGVLRSSWSSSIGLKFNLVQLLSQNVIFRARCTNAFMFPISRITNCHNLLLYTLENLDQECVKSKLSQECLYHIISKEKNIKKIISGMPISCARCKGQTFAALQKRLSFFCSG